MTWLTGSYTTRQKMVSVLTACIHLTTPQRQMRPLSRGTLCVRRRERRELGAHGQELPLA